MPRPAICDLFDMGQKLIHEGGDIKSFGARLRAETGLDLDDAAVKAVFEKGVKDYAKSGAKAATEATRKYQTQLAKEMMNLQRSGALETITGLRRAGLLSNVRTLARNVSGNAASAAFDEVARIPGAVADMAIGKLTGTRTLLGPDARSVMGSVGESITKGSRQVLETLKQGATAEDLAKFDIPRELNLSHLGKAGKPVQSYVNFVNRLQSGTDKWARVYAFSRSIDEQAQIIARAEKLSGADFKTRVSALRAAPSEQMAIQAQLHAEEAVFANSNQLAGGLDRLAGSLGKGGKFTLDTLVPFKRTPTNIVGRTLESTPLGYIKAGALIKQALKDPAAQREFSKTFGRATSGTALMALGMHLYRNGSLTPGYSYSAGERGREEAAGRTPGSILVGGTWQKLTDSPAGMVMVLGASYAKELDDEYKTPVQKITGLGKQTGAVVADSPLLGGAEEATKILEDPLGQGLKMAKELPKSFLPSDVRPSKTRVDAFGEEVKQSPLYRHILPTGGSVDKSNDPVISQILKYKVPLGAIKRKAGETDKEYESRQKRTGKAVRAALEELVSGQYWKNANDKNSKQYMTSQERRQWLMDEVKRVRSDISKDITFEREAMKK